MSRCDIGIVTAGFLAASVALVGCTGAEEKDGKDFEADELFTTYTANIDASADIQRGIDQLAGVCLRELGVESNYIPDVIPEMEDPEDKEYLIDLRDRVSFEEAEEHGYTQWWPGLFDVSSYEPDETDDDFLVRDAQQLVYAVKGDAADARDHLTGADFHNRAVAEAGFELAELEEFFDQNPEGCNGVVADLVFEGEREHWEEISAIAVTGLRTEDNYEFNTLQNEWLDCMAFHGFDEVTDYYSLHELQVEHMYNDMSTEKFDAKQRELALSDAEYSEELNVNERHQAIADELLTEHVREGEAAFFEFQELAAKYSVRIQEHIEEGEVLG